MGRQLRHDRRAVHLHQSGGALNNKFYAASRPQAHHPAEPHHILRHNRLEIKLAREPGQNLLRLHQQRISFFLVFQQFHLHDAAVFHRLRPPFPDILAGDFQHIDIFRNKQLQTGKPALKNFIFKLGIEFDGPGLHRADNIRLHSGGKNFRAADDLFPVDSAAAGRLENAVINRDAVFSFDFRRETWCIRHFGVSILTGQRQPDVAGYRRQQIE